MKYVIHSLVVILTVSLVLMPAIGTAPAAAEKIPKVITLSAGAMGQSLYMLMALMSRWLPEAVPGLQKATVIAGGSSANPKLVDRGEVDIAMTSHPTYGEALRGEGPYKKKYSDLRVLATAQGYGVFYFMVRKETGLKSIPEFIEKKYPLKIGTFLKAASQALNTERLLQEYGATFDDVKKWGGAIHYGQWGDVVNLYRDGHVNAMVGNTTLPSHFHEEAARARPTRILPLEQKVVDVFEKKYRYIPVTIPKGTFDIVEEDLLSFGYTYFVFAHKNLPDEIAYQVVKQMAEHTNDIRTVHSTFKPFMPEKMTTHVLGEIHPGAARFYREKGWLK